LISRPQNLASEPGKNDSEKHKNNTNEASMLLKKHGAFGKRTQNELKNEPNLRVSNAGTNAEFRICESRREDPALVYEEEGKYAQVEVHDRSIDRKVRTLLTMRKEPARMFKEAASPPGDELPRAGADTPPRVCNAGQDSEARPSLRETQTPNGRGLRQPGSHTTESPAEENAGETSKSPEQSENVIENKGPAADGAPVMRSAVACRGPSL
jgi:hypothetical protein